MKNEDKIKLAVELATFACSNECHTPAKINNSGSRGDTERQLDALIKSLYKTINSLDEETD